MQELDNVQINFDANGLLLLNVALALVMFGVALGITINDFKNLFKQPKIILAGILSQFFLLPLLTFGLVIVSGIIVYILSIITCGIGILFLAAFIYLPIYIIYKEVIGFGELDEINKIGKIDNL